MLDGLIADLRPHSDTARDVYLLNLLLLSAA
jgi:hypothetical protein